MRVFFLIVTIFLFALSCAPQWATNREVPDQEDRIQESQKVVEKTVEGPGPTNRSSSFQMDEKLFEKFKTEIQQFWEAPYVWGGASPQGTDCSGMIMTIYRKAADIKVPRNTRLMWERGNAVAVEKLQMGDLVFFNDNGRGTRPTHVGIFIDKGVFIHASASRGVTTDRLADGYYSTRYLGARRFLN